MKANVKNEYEDRMYVMSVLNLLPANETEMEVFIDLLRKEMLVHPDPLSVLKQLKWCERTIAEALVDKDIKRRIYLEALTYGQNSFSHKDTMYGISETSEDVQVAGF
jgi:hypothetical protein